MGRVRLAKTHPGSRRLKRACPLHLCVLPTAPPLQPSMFLPKPRESRSLSEGEGRSEGTLVPMPSPSTKVAFFFFFFDMNELDRVWARKGHCFPWFCFVVAGGGHRTLREPSLVLEGFFLNPPPTEGQIRNTRL